MKITKLFLPLIFVQYALFVSCQKAGVKPVVVNTPVRVIVVLGSSTAAGVGASTFDSSWVGRLKARLIADKKNVKVIDLAVSAYTTYHVLPTGYQVGGRPIPDTNANVTKALKYKPFLVIINLPSNDIALGFADQEILYNFDFITRVLKYNSVPFILASNQPRNFSDLATRTRLKTLNDSLIARYGDTVNNYLSKLSTSTWQILPQYSAGDGIHLNNAGHKLIYESFINHKLFRQKLNY